MTTSPQGPTPQLVDLITGIVSEMLGSYAQASGRRNIEVPVVRTGTVTDTDPTAGTVTVVFDDDAAQSSGQNPASTTVTVAGVSPPPGARVLAMFVDGAVYSFGVLGPAQLLLAPTQDVTLISGGHPFQIGFSDALNVAYDENEIQARFNNAASRLSLNHEGGEVESAGVLMASGKPVGASATTTAYLYNTTLWPGGATAYGMALTFDGRTILNFLGGSNYIDLRAADASVFKVGINTAQPAGSQAVLTVAPGLPQIASVALGIVGTSQQIARIPSASIYKRDIETEPRDRLADAMLALEPVRYRYLDNPGIIDRAANDRFLVGFRAEDVYDEFPEAVHLGPHPDEPLPPYEDGWEPPEDTPDAPHPDHVGRRPLTLDTLTREAIPAAVYDAALIAGLTALCQRQQGQIDALTERLDALTPA